MESNNHNNSDSANNFSVMSRRSLLSALGGGALGLASQARSAPAFPLKTLAAQKGLRFGTAVGANNPALKQGTLYDAGYRNLILDECNILVAENEHKMYTIMANEGPYQFARGDAISTFARDNNIALRGHTLLWARDEFTPEWLKSYDFGANPATKAAEMLNAYVRTVAGHYATQPISWDVVNEAVTPETSHVRNTVFTRKMGPEALLMAYHTAREVLPDTQLVYNDYMSWEAGNEKHREGVLNLLAYFRKHDAPVQALGVQSHLGNGFNIKDSQVDAWKSFLDEAVSMGYDLLITELDVADTTISDISSRDRITAETLSAYMDIMLSYPQLKDILAWGLVNRFSWLQGFRPREDRQALRCCLFDDAYKPTPMYYAMAEALKKTMAR